MTVIRKEIRIRAPRKLVWRYFSDANLLAAWMMRNDFTAAPGESFSFFAEPSGDWDGQVRCSLLEYDPPAKIAFTWDANTIGADTVVTIELEERGEETFLRLTHANFEQAAGDVDRLVERHDAGWDDHLSVLLKQAEDDAGDYPRRRIEPDWTRFDLHVAIAASPEELVSYWSTARGMQGFFVEMMRITRPDGQERGVDEPASPGDAFTWRWHSGYRLSGEYLPVQAENEVRFTFGDSRIAVRAVPHGNGSLLRLRQYDIPDTEAARMHVYANCRAAWVYFMTVLKALVEHGIDARDTTRATGASFSTHFDPSDLGIEF
jgi:uncharacterized protein YndB with AHSA1/START domain